jgi:hypothetical protein
MFPYGSVALDILWREKIEAYIFLDHLAWYAEFLYEIDLKILLRKTGARLIFKIALISLNIDPGS